MIVLNTTFVDHPFGELKLLHGFVKKSERESIQLKQALGKDYGYSLRAVPCLFTLRLSTNFVSNFGF